MDQELKAKWVSALRGGKFSQGRQALYERGRYCCLGVLVSCATGAAEEKVYGNSRGYSLAEEILGGAGLSTLFQDMNDGTGGFRKGRKTFAEIADYIEAKL